MRTLFIIRHAKSSWDSPSLRDFDRPLNERGLRDAPTMANLLFQRGVRPDLIVSSPANRALTTARFFARAFDIAETDITQVPEIYEAYPQTILRIISQLPNAARTVLMFGHNPTFTDVANHFNDKYIPNLPTCGIVQIETSAETWADMSEFNAKLVATFFPKEI